jgi:xanthine dehydrogenase small subunit
MWIHFILNEKTIATDLPAGMVLLDFIRYHEHLTGTKIGCREGDCGACTILVGEIKDNRLQYSSATCCLMPLGNAQGKHIVTIEGINTASLNPIQEAMADEGATQCGFCTPGFVVSLAGFCLDDKKKASVLSAIDGNICRCTGYKSIERAAQRVAGLMEEKKDQDPVSFVVEKNILPSYLTTIKERLTSLRAKTNGSLTVTNPMRFVGGGTDLYVQRHDEMKEADLGFLFDEEALNGIVQKEKRCYIGPSATVTDIVQSLIFRENFPRLDAHMKLVSSTPIRNMATLAGNFVNASPIGDLTIFFLALDAQLVLRDGSKKRELPLRKMYRGYKQLDKTETEIIDQVWFSLPGAKTRFNFEKVSKRTHLDIASVNSAICIRVENGIILDAGVSAGGVGPIPMFLEKTGNFLRGKKLTEQLIEEAISYMQEEISPISDARGSAAYKRLLLGQLFKAHFLQLFPDLITEQVLTAT